MNELYVRNRQRRKRIDLKRFQEIASTLAERTFPAGSSLGVILVGDSEMTRLNETFLGHAGSTDVIAFHYDGSPRKPLHGEVFLCIDEALRQARRFRTSWEKELVRYLVHGLLHFKGYEDSTLSARRRMKRVENRQVAELARHFCLSRLCRAPKVPA